MDLLFYVILVVVVVLKLLFWIFYFYARSRRQQQLSELRRETEQMPEAGQYEEQPAVPQPAYMFTEYPFGANVTHAFQIPPEYAEEDPGKLDQPPPPYIEDNDQLILVEHQEN